MQVISLDTWREPGASSLTGSRPAGSQQSVHCNPALMQLARARSVLLLQGPLGPFFDRLTVWLRSCGAQVARVALHGGDEHDCRAVHPIAYVGTQSDWPAFFADTVARLAIDCVVLFGQSRQYHKAASDVAKSLGLPVVVLEEGYFRPGYITMELGGVNGYSTTLQRYQWHPLAMVKGSMGSILPPGDMQPDISPWHFQKMAWHASQHYIALDKARTKYAHYQHHRGDSPRQYAAYWLRSWRRKLAHKAADLRFQQSLVGGTRSYYFVPLQHDGDAQITHHSPFVENAEFIIRVIRSFALHAPADALLVFRQHPHARGGPGHSEFILSLATELDVGDRVHHLVEGDTPELAEHSAGVVLINSTVGLQALERGAPLMVLGDALYKQPQLTFAGDLDAFWNDARPPERAGTMAFLAQMKNLTQAPVSVYALRDEPIRWGHL